MRSAVVSIDPKTGGVKAYYGGSDANGFDFAQAGLPTGSSFKVFALVAALQQGIGLGYQVDSSPVEVNGIKITNVEGEGCGVCNIAEALKMSLNTSYYRLMLKLKNGPQDVADAAHQAGIAESFPGVEHTLSEDGKGGPPNNGIVLGQYQTRVHRHGLGVRHAGQLGRLPQAALRAEGGQRRRSGAVRRRPSRTTPASRRSTRPSPTTSPPRCSRSPAIPGATTWPAAAPSAAKTGTNQLGDTDANRDAWMVGYTPSLSTAVWVGTTEGTKPLVNAGGGAVYGSGLPSDIWKATMDGALEGTDNETFPKPTEIGGYAGVPQAPPPPARAASPVGDGDPADHRSRHRASPSRSVPRRRCRCCRPRHQVTRERPYRRRSPRRSLRRLRRRDGWGFSSGNGVASAVGRGSSERRRPRHAQSHRRDRRARCRAWSVGRSGGTR